MPIPIGSTPFTDDDLKAIGEVVVAGALLERMFDVCIWRLVRADPFVQISITAGLRTHSKAIMLGTLGRIRLEGDELEEFKHALGHARQVLGKRDRIAHGAPWDIGETEDIVRYLQFKAEKGVEFKLFEITKEEIAQLSTDLGHARTRLYRAIEPFCVRMRAEQSP